MPNRIANQEDCPSVWQQLPDSLLLQIFACLPAQSLVRVAQTCKEWQRVALDEYLWKDLFYTSWKIDPKVPMAPGKSSWIREYKRLYFNTPIIQSEELKEHRDQVLHVSFSHKGDMFATSSKDGYIKVWNAEFPATVKYSADLKKFTWKYTQYSQFNESDTLLLVSGVHFGSHSTSGEIAVFSLQGDFELQCRVLNKPYDIFGTWYNDSYLLSGNLHWLGHLTSCSALWLNKAFQATDSEQESVVMRLFSFRNVNASSIRTIMIANCFDANGKKTRNQETSLDPHSIGVQAAMDSNSDKNIIGSSPTHSECSSRTCRLDGKQSQKMQMFEDGAHRLRLLEVDDDDSNSCDSLNGTIEYYKEYRDAQSKGTRSTVSMAAALAAAHAAVRAPADCAAPQPPEPKEKAMEAPRAVASGSMDCTAQLQEPKESAMDQASPKGATKRHMDSRTQHSDAKEYAMEQGPRASATKRHSDCLSEPSEPKECAMEQASCGTTTGAMDCQAELPKPQVSGTKPGRENSKVRELCQMPGVIDPIGDSAIVFPPGDQGQRDPVPRIPISASESCIDTLRHQYDMPKSPASSRQTLQDSDWTGSESSLDTQACGPPTELMGQSFCDKYLIFTTGVQTYTPHQIGIKRIKSLEAARKADLTCSEQGVRLLPNVDENHQGLNQGDFDEVDHLIELHGHIIGMCLSPDHRYLYVNSRPWPTGYEIDDPLFPPPIAQEIDIHVIDLRTMQEVGTMHRAHKAYTPNDECFFIFLDVCDEYVASGAEDKHGYLWDRHYGVCLTKFPHNDVVNSVAFNTKDSETLVTASDDFSIKIWRSRNRELQVKGRITKA